jgi:nitrogenase molybdenum-iron protein beta chain
LIETTDAQKTLSREKIRGLVNVLGILPKTDPFYKGDAQEIKRLLAGAGIQANIFFAPCGGINDLEQSSRAEHTLVFSHWGIAAARQLEELYGTPYTVFDSLPLGMEDTRDFFTRLSSLINMDSAAAQEFLRQEEIRYSYYLTSLADTYYTHALQKTLAIVGDTSAVIRLGTFLRKCLGAEIRTAVITDGYAHGKDAERPNLPDGIAEEVFTTGDSEEIEKIVGAADAEMILGSALEEPAARRLKIPHLTVSSPIGSRVLLHKTYTGIEGVFFLLEDYAQAVTQASTGLRAETRRSLAALNVFNPRS